MQFKSFMEAMKGKQHKIDKNKNGKIDAHDFKLLQKEEAEELEEASVKSEKHSWGKMMTVHHGASHSYPLHPEHQEAIRNLKHGEKTSFKDETGAKVNVHRDVQDVHFTSNKTSTKTTVPHSHFNEENEDRMAQADYKTSPSGRKSHKEIVFNSSEEDKTKETVKEAKEEDPPFDGPYTKTTPVKNSDGTTQSPMSRARELAKKAIAASNKKTNEEVEQIEEKSDQAKQNKTMKNMMDASRGARYKLNNPVPDAEPEHKTARAHNVAIGRSLRKEEAEELDELSKSTLGSYVKKASRDSTILRKIGADFENMADKSRKPSSKAASTELSNKYKSKSWSRRDGLDKAVDRLTKEETVYEAKDEQEYGYEGDMALNQLATLTRCAEMIKETLKPDTDLPEWVQSKITLATDYIQTAADYMHSELEEQAPVAPVPDRKYIKGTPENKALKASRKPINGMPTGKMKEEVEQIDELSTNTLNAYKDKVYKDYRDGKPGNSSMNRITGVRAANKRLLAKEEVENEGTTMSISYKDFLQMNEIKMSELPSRMVKGHSYGATYEDPEGADDYDDKKPVKTAPEKRGRGRPAGAQSGARKNLGNSKLHSK